MKKEAKHLCSCGRNHHEYLEQAKAAHHFLSQLGLKVELEQLPLKEGVEIGALMTTLQTVSHTYQLSPINGLGEELLNIMKNRFK